MDVAFSYIDADGFHNGRGPAKGLVNKLARCLCAGVRVPGMPPMFIQGPVDLEWATDVLVNALSGEVVGSERFWGFAPPPGHRVWLPPDGSWVGIAPQPEHVEAVREALTRRR